MTTAEDCEAYSERYTQVPRRFVNWCGNVENRGQSTIPSSGSANEMGGRKRPSPPIIAAFAVRCETCKHDRFWHGCARLRIAVVSVYDSTA